MSELASLLVAAVAIGSLAVAVATYFTTRRKDEGTRKAEAKINEFTILTGTVDVLRDNLNDANDRVDELEGKLAAALKDVGRLNEQVTVALANVTILSNFIEDHVAADVQRPMLRRMG